MQTLAPPRTADLAHIPHLPATPLVGHTLDLLRDPYGLHARSRETLGDVYKIKLLGQWRVTLGGADSLELILGDRDQLFSSHGGWDMLHTLFPGGLMLRDFEDHRAHRRIMQSAFRKPVMDAYRDRMDKLIPDLLATWPLEQRFKGFPAIKDLTLRIGVAVFMGLPLDDPRVERLNAAFQAEVAASLGIIRIPLPGTKLRKGVQARAYLLDAFRDMIPERRTAPGDDFFSQMCCAVDEDGTRWNETEILDHFNFLMMAAHDTTASSLTKVFWALGAHPYWQDRVIAEVDALPEGPVSDEMLARLDATDRVFREVLRMQPPVPFIPRRAVRDFEWRGISVPAGTWVSALPGMVMMSSEHWSDPHQFDPDRFSPNRAEDQSHKYAWAPFGGGAHKCIGLHFATQQVKLVLIHLLKRSRIELPEGSGEDWQRIPIPQPRDGLPMLLRPRA